jgi:3-carboxy-cis,cis-muconate cycloisomerase
LTDELFRPIFVPDKFRQAVSGGAWLQAMLEAEGALAVAQGRVGLIPPDAAEAIASCCKKGPYAGLFDPEELGRKGRSQGNPVPPLVRALTEEVSGVSEEAARYVHKGATSQDIVDTAAMLLTKRTLGMIIAETHAVAAALARLAEAHRDTPIAARTLLQQALPTTFGLKAAGWLVSILEARRRLLDVRAMELAAQLGGACGTVAHRPSPHRSDRWYALAPLRRARKDLARHHLDGPDRGRRGLRARWTWRFFDAASQAKPHPLRDHRRLLATGAGSSAHAAVGDGSGA